jgi:hypothetical protein
MGDEERGTERPVAWGVWVRMATSGGGDGYCAAW